MSKVRTVAAFSTVIVSSVVAGTCIGCTVSNLQEVNDEHIESCDDLSDAQKKFMKVCNHVGTYCITIATSAKCGEIVGTLARKTILKA